MRHGDGRRNPLLELLHGQPDRLDIDRLVKGLAHAPVGLPELLCTTSDLELAQRIIAQLGEGRSPVTAEELAELFAMRRGNLRDVLFDLYDRFERRRADW